jgi:thymidylate synthase
MKQYLDLVQHVMDNGCQKEIERNRYKSVFGYQMRFDLSEGFPMVNSRNYTSNLSFMSYYGS